MTSARLRLLILGAHPDDAEFHAGGLAAIYCRLGHVVKMVSVTDGRSGHHLKRGDALAAIRRAEAEAAARVIGATYQVWDWPDGELVANLDVRRQIIGEMRSFRPDLVLTHRTCDYHPDHRAVGMAVQDASYMVTVPPIMPDVPALRTDPVVAYLPDRFTKPYPLVGDVVVDVTDEVDTIVRMLACHRSQMFEWLPYNQGVADEVPDGELEELAWLRGRYESIVRPTADRYRDRLIATYGEARGRAIELAEVFEVSEYAGRFDDAARRRLFPFLP